MDNDKKQLSELAKKLEPSTKKIQSILTSANVGVLAKSLEDRVRVWEETLVEMNKKYAEQEKTIEQLRGKLEEIWSNSEGIDDSLLELESTIKSTKENIQQLQALGQ